VLSTKTVSAGNVVIAAGVPVSSSPALLYIAPPLKPLFAVKVVEPMRLAKREVQCGAARRSRRRKGRD